MRTYKQLIQEQRYQIDILLKAGNFQHVIAALLDVSKSSISRELSRNKGTDGYDPKPAQQKADTRRKLATKAIKMTPSLIAEIEARIKLDWSPEQVSGQLKDERGVMISHERIYQHVWANKLRGGLLYKHLRQCHKKRKKKYGSKDKRGQIRNRVSIEERPSIVAEKTRIGDWEIDTVIGQNHQGALVTIVDRASKFTLIKKVDSKHAEVVTAATIMLLKPYLDKTLTITADNGKEFAGHETIKEQLNANVYFAHPYCSWERGLNENTNGLIRQYFTKGSSFENITDKDVEDVMYKLNHRPRKTLDFKTPYSVFFADTLHGAA
jgi:IS30 family transposase